MYPLKLRHIWPLLVLSMALLMASCGSETTGNKGEEDTPSYIFDDIYDEPSGGGKDTGDPNDWYNPPEIVPTTTNCELFFLVDPTLPFNVLVNDSTPLRVKVIDYLQQQPATQQPVQFEIVDGSGDAQVTPALAYTSNEGIATVTFKGGTVGDTNYVVKASTSCSQTSEEITIHVADTPKGDLKVNLIWDNGIPLNEIKVSIITGGYTCMDFFATNPPDDEALFNKTVSSIYASPVFEELSSELKYMVYATAKSGSTTDPANPLHLTAAGCIDTIGIVPDEVNEANLTMYLLTLNPSGTYEVVNKFDFTDAIPGEVGMIVDKIVDLFYDPGDFIIETILEIVGLYFGEIWETVADLVLGPFQDQLTDLITDWLLNNSPPWMQCFFIVGQDIVQIVANVELEALLKLSKLSSDYVIQGEEDWIGLNLYWTWGCSTEGPCAREPNAIRDLCFYDETTDKCKCNFSLNQLEDTDVPMDLITGYFYANVANFDLLSIQLHKIQLNYGKLILFVINELVLPAVSGGEWNSIYDLVYAVVDCHSIAYGFIGDLLDNIGVDPADVESFCDGAVNFMVTPVIAIIDGLTLDSKLWISGSCKMQDLDDDLNVDRLIDGVWNGHIDLDGESGPPFYGTFFGTKMQ